MDDLIKLATGGISSTSAMGEGVTEGTISLFLVDNSAIFHEQEGQIID
jgi:Isocitrate lyase family